MRVCEPHPPRLKGSPFQTKIKRAVHLPLYIRSIRYRRSWLRPSDLAAHGLSCLMLLGSPPDMVHRRPLRKTKPSTLLAAVRRHIEYPGAGVRPRYSGLRVQGTAGSPTSTAPGAYYTPRTGFYQVGLYKSGICDIMHERPRGGVAQLGERSVRIREVEGSNPFVSTTSEQSLLCSDVFISMNVSNNNVLTPFSSRIYYGRTTAKGAPRHG